MDNYRSIKCGDVHGKRSSSKLPGALASNQDFFYFGGGDECYYIWRPVSVFVPSKFVEDYKNKIYVSEDGAVVDAYDFRKLSDREIELAIKTIITEKKIMFPEYEFTMRPDSFPIDVINDNAIMSTHVLYIQNYKDFLEKNNNKVK